MIYPPCGILLNSKKEWSIWSIDLCNNLDKSPRNHTKCKKPIPTYTTWYVSIHITFLKSEHHQSGEQVSGLRRSQAWQGSRRGYERAKWGTLVIKMFWIWTVLMAISWLWCYMLLPLEEIGFRMYMTSLYYFSTTGCEWSQRKKIN